MRIYRGRRRGFGVAMTLASVTLLTCAPLTSAAEDPTDVGIPPAEAQAPPAEEPVLDGVPEQYDVPEGYDNAGPADGRSADVEPVDGADLTEDALVGTAEVRELDDLNTVDHVEATASCSWYVSPSGRTGNSGRSSGSPLPLRTAAGRTQPGDTVCLAGGVYYLSSALNITRSGSSGRYITYRSNGGTPELRWTGSRGYELIMLSGTRYIEIRGLRLHGANRANNAIFCRYGGHHIRVLYNSISSTGTGGVTAKGCDYTTVHRNHFHHIGYGTGWGSAVSINESRWLDGYSGFHSFVTANIISGTYDNSDRDTDGNGIILDRAAVDYSTPRLLVANNVVFANYGRCIHGYRASNMWVVNNTCYRSNLGGKSEGEFNLYAVSGARMINNVAWSSSNGHPFKDIRGSGATYERNIGYGGRSSIVPSGVSGTSRLRVTNPRFQNPFSISGWSSAPTPGSIGSRLAPESGSPLVSGGIDPRYAYGVNSNMRAGMQQYLTTDVTGAYRSGAWDIGAYAR